MGGGSEHDSLQNALNVDKEGFRGFDFEYKLEYNIILCDSRDRGHEDFSDYDVVVREAFIEKDSGAINEGSMGCWQYCGGNDTDTMPCICDEPDQTCDDKAYLECLYKEAEYMGYGKREHAEYYDLRGIVVESTGNISYGYINRIGSVDAHITSDELNIESVFKTASPVM